MRDPFDPQCGWAAAAAHMLRRPSTKQSAEALNRSVIETAVMRAPLSADAVRRRFLSAVGASTALSAISSLVPLPRSRRWRRRGSRPRRRISRSASSDHLRKARDHGDPLGFYREQGLNVQLIKTAAGP